MKLHREALDLLHAHEHTDKRDEANRRIYATRQRRCWEVYPDIPVINRVLNRIPAEYGRGQQSGRGTKHICCRATALHI